MTKARDKTLGEAVNVKIKRELIILGIAIGIALLQGGRLIGRRECFFHFL